MVTRIPYVIKEIGHVKELLATNFEFAADQHENQIDADAQKQKYLSPFVEISEVLPVEVSTTIFIFYWRVWMHFVGQNFAQKSKFIFSFSK